ncbi:hypothetical protein PFFVO_02101 [Plasmodium falciparum Vietnam Oak-Knoll (FVO)]|uniref:Uncharacterized protein n=1 Tax=Plasmodium falciparum Vietnam Oak-Knoll (FVO) TaxID=1036723 RepID=A0A024V937_PLAFA|nr:hypothetical protein PFFVO_02101 [Plasmodium falciparum Vietnam Oak-Knoll (FVO)]
MFSYNIKKNQKYINIKNGHSYTYTSHICLNLIILQNRLKEKKKKKKGTQIRPALELICYILKIRQTVLFIFFLLKNSNTYLFIKEKQ